MCAWADQANDGLSRKEAIDNIQELNQSISREATSKQLSRCVLPTNAKAGITKSQCQKVQATTSERTNINVAQKFRWHSLVDHIYNLVREKNTGVCSKTGKSFGELIQQYIVGLDEMCLQGDAHGSCTIIGSVDKKKHEKLLQDGRVSITLICTGSVGGSTGPTVFLLKGGKEEEDLF